jgi:hypothetical protein
MCAPDPVSYPLLLAVLKAVLGPLPTVSLTAVAALVWALLLSQSLHPAALARALPDLQTPHARQALRRVRRGLGRRVLTSEQLTPWLLAAALRLVPAGPVLLVLDSTRCQHWEIFTLGVRFHGRVLPIAWSILPYPWPKKQFTPTVVALLTRTLALWPPDRPVHLVADRGFPSLPFFRCLDRWRAERPLDYTIRLRAADWVRLDTAPATKVGDLERAVRPGTWAQYPAAFQRRQQAGAAVTLVVGSGLPLYPAHQVGPADCARRAQRAQRRTHHVQSKAQDATLDRQWALLTTTPSWRQAVPVYHGRFTTEGTYRDLKSWDWAAVAAHETDAAHLDALVGLAALAYCVQAALGAAAGRTADVAARARQQQWCTTARLSPFWRGRQVLHDRAHNWRPWLHTQLPSLAHTLAGFPPPQTPADTEPAQQEAA